MAFLNFSGSSMESTLLILSIAEETENTRPGLPPRVRGIPAKGATAAQWLWNSSMRAGHNLLGIVPIMKNRAAQIGTSVATKGCAAAQWLWNMSLSAGHKLLSVGRLVVYKATSVAASTATKAWTATQWLWNASMSVGRAASSMSEG